MQAFFLSNKLNEWMKDEKEKHLFWQTISFPATLARLITACKREVVDFACFG